MMRTLFGRVYRLSPAWLGAVAGGAVAGATVVPTRRVLAGAIGGGAVLALALWRAGEQTRPVADAAPLVTDEPHLEAAPSRVAAPEDWRNSFSLNRTPEALKGGCCS